MRETAGSVLLVLLLMTILTVPLVRLALQDEGPPAFYPEPHAGIAVALGEGFSRPGTHRFSDGSRFWDVIKMAIDSLPLKSIPESLLDRPLQSGEYLEILQVESQAPVIKRSWMPSGQRIALGIPLHPDRMSRDDWQVLPGAGPRLAETIEEDRHKNGDFGSLERLTRVRGIGPRRIISWREFFSAP